MQASWSRFYPFWCRFTVHASVSEVCKYLDLSGLTFHRDTQSSAYFYLRFAPLQSISGPLSPKNDSPLSMKRVIRPSGYYVI